MSSSKLLKSTALYGILNFLPLVSRFLLFPFFVNLLTPFDFGLISLHTSVASLLTILISIGLDSAYTRFYFDYEGDSIKSQEYLSTIFISTLLIGFFIGLVLFFTGDFIFSRIFEHGFYSFSPYGIYAYIFGFASSLNSIVLIYLRNKEKLTKYFLFSVSVFTLIIALECLVVFGDNPSANQVLLARIVGLLIPSILFWVFAFTKGFVFRVHFLKDSLKYSAPIFLSTLLGFTYLYFDRILVGNMLSIEKLSIYITALMIASVMGLSLNAIDLAITPSLFRFYKNNEFKLARTLLNSVGYFVYLLAAVILLLSPTFITRFTPDHYESAILIIPVFLIGYVFGFLLGAINRELSYFKKVNKIPLINFTAGIALILSSIFLIPSYGLLGASWAMVISRFATVIVSIFIIKADLGTSFRFLKIYKNAIIIITILMIPVIQSRIIFEYGAFYLSSILILLYFIPILIKTQKQVHSLLKHVVK